MASNFPDKPFILHPQRMTFKELDTFSDKLAAALADMGVGKGNTVGLFMFNSPEFIVSLFGALKTGATVTAVNPLLREGEAKQQLEDSESVAVIADDETYPVFKNIHPELPKLKNAIVFKGSYLEVLSLWELIEKYPPNPPEVEIDPVEDLALLQYTANKMGCMLTHYNVATNSLQLSEVLGLRKSGQEDVIMGHLPFSHVYGLMFSIFLPISAGPCSLVVERRFDIEEILDHIGRFKITIFPTIMTVIAFLVDASELLKKYDLSSLRLICSGAMPIKAGVARELQHLTSVTVTQGYGLSETPSVTHLNPLNGIKLESVGVPIPGTEQKIVDLETGNKLRPGEVGEILVGGPQVMKGYWKRPEETAEVLRDGWLYTGDIGKIDEDGYLHIVGRKKDVVKFKGFAIGLDELEEVLRKHPAVEECVVVPKPSPIAGEIPKALVALRKGFEVTEMELIEFVEARVAEFKKIREIEFVREIPKEPVDRMVYRKRSIEREMERVGIPVKHLVDKMVTRIRKQAGE